MPQPPEEILKNLRRWEIMANLLRIIHILLGIVAITSSLLVAAKINSFDAVLIEWLAFLAALSTALLSGFNLGNKANRMRAAWRLLNTARLKYELEDTYTIGELIDCYNEAETIVGDVKEEPK